MVDNKNIDVAKELIQALGFPIKGSYKPAEVCKILGISKRTFFRMTNEYERDLETGRPLNPGMLDSYRTLGEKRVLINELANYFERNNTYEKQNSILKTELKKH